MRGTRRIETVGRYEGAKSPDWSMAPSFVRAHAECQYQFLKAVAEDTPSVPTLADGLHIQAVMAAAEESAQEERWVQVADMLR
jgi:predicted dehydrogenase